ncbi:hypothetical protein FHX34_101768 [Actinoplanes teichomyceticus]|uniref:Uncharacterized protein n=1 Tax=Actinoplanes teichomyceticus TaxID=1867 RepID=A0A561WPJ4_ACTTI|nr:hypothetical protein FHX34_101768 [Actinoplanes teichomyceticus]
MFADSDNGGGTDWMQRTVPQMWAMLAPHDGAAHKDLLLTWKQSADLLVDHLTRVKRYRDNLAEAWPPEKSAASATYLGRLDDLIDHLSATYHATVENHRALGAATSALVSARHRLEAIYREHAANQQELADIARKRQTSGEVVGKWREVTLTPAAVSESRQMELQLQAQSVMSTLSTDLAMAQLNINNPKPYNPSQSFEWSEPLHPISIDASPRMQDRIPPSPTGQPESPSIAAIKDNSVSFGISSPNNQPRPSLPDSATNPGPWPASTPGNPGPALSGITTPAAGPPLHQPALIPQGSGTEANPTTGGTNLPLTPGPTSLPSRLRDTRTSINHATHPNSPAHGAQVPTQGGMIGGAPVSDSTHARTNPGRTQRVNPSGGIIGQPVVTGGSPIRGTSRSGDPEARDNHWDPDNPWATGHGISPIITPPEKQKVDPGPAIGLP